MSLFLSRCQAPTELPLSGAPAWRLSCGAGAGGLSTWSSCPAPGAQCLPLPQPVEALSPGFGVSELVRAAGCRGWSHSPTYTGPCPGLREVGHPELEPGLGHTPSPCFFPKPATHALETGVPCGQHPH